MARYMTNITHNQDECHLPDWVYSTILTIAPQQFSGDLFASGSIIATMLIREVRMKQSTILLIIHMVLGLVVWLEDHDDNRLRVIRLGIVLAMMLFLLLVIYFAGG